MNLKEKWCYVWSPILQHHICLRCTAILSTDLLYSDIPISFLYAFFSFLRSICPRIPVAVGLTFLIFRECHNKELHYNSGLILTREMPGHLIRENGERRKIQSEFLCNFRSSLSATHNW